MWWRGYADWIVQAPLRGVMYTMRPRFPRFVLTKLSSVGPEKEDSKVNTQSARREIKGVGHVQCPNMIDSPLRGRRGSIGEILAFS
jgi:hypothetical protein